MEKHELGWTTAAFFPDVREIKNHEQGRHEALAHHYDRAKYLAVGALAVLDQGDGPADENGSAARALIGAFLDAMQMGEEAFEDADIHNRPPLVTFDELKKMLGDLGHAEVKVIVDNDGFVNFKMVRVGRDLSSALPKANGKKNGKAKGKAA